MVAAQVRPVLFAPPKLTTAGAHENLDGCFMIIPFRAAGPARKIDPGGAPPGRQPLDEGPDIMKWETPEAVDFRFGMEITMYVANR